ncbi:MULTISPECIES: DUF2514 family protein [unclassified Pseudomonas]|uniref:DUF2514 family protein n=1 Tax=unclassified Pseudomonas TaxID=196821 RepID=UPI000BE40CB0|nr:MULTISPECIES: DUF2514 family protein [unclassified Pseudomonas]
MTPIQKLIGMLVLILLLMAGSAAVAWRWQANSYGLQLAELAKTKEQEIAKAEQQARVEEQRRQSAVEKVRSDAQEQNKAATADAGAADVAGDRLHVTADEFASRFSGSTCDPSAAQRGASAVRAAMVLSDLLQRADKRAGELAAAYDQARVAGLACEAAYDSLRVKGGRSKAL